MPDWVFYTIVAVVCGILIISFVGGFGMIMPMLKRNSSKFLAYFLLSLFLFPAMFTSCATINWLAKDEKHDAFGFEYPDLQERTGFSTRSARRERLVENAFSYITSAHGIFSILTALVLGSPFIWCLWKANQEAEIVSLDAYWAIVVPLALVFLVIYAKS